MRALLLYIFLPLFAHAHPGIGIVKDSKGNIYYTDLHHVWKINTLGHKSIAVQSVHTHELFMDAQDNLFGEHLWYNGKNTDTWGHYVWKLNKDGRLDTVIHPREGFLTHYSFVRDAAGNMYWAEQFTNTKFKKKYTDSTIHTIAEGKFKDLKWMHATPSGVLYFVQGNDLYRVDTAGNLHLMARQIAQQTATFSSMNGKHNLLGIWTDKNENVYVANFSGQVIRQIRPDGSIYNAVYSTSPWSPTGGLFDEAGNLWVLEASLTNEVQVRKVFKEEIASQNKTGPYMMNNSVPFLLIVLFLVVVVTCIVWFVKKRNRVIPIVHP